MKRRQSMRNNPKWFKRRRTQRVMDYKVMQFGQVRDVLDASFSHAVGKTYRVQARQSR